MTRNFSALSGDICLQTARLAICFRRHDRTPLHLGQVDISFVLGKSAQTAFALLLMRLRDGAR